MIQAGSKVTVVIEAGYRGDVLKLPAAFAEHFCFPSLDGALGSAYEGTGPVTLVSTSGLLRIIPEYRILHVEERP